MSQYDAVVKQWQAWNVKTISNLNLRLDNFRILFAFNSGRIENPNVSYHDTHEIFENGKVVGYTGSTRTLFEQQNQKTCYEFLLEKLAAREPISVTLIRDIHRVLTEGTYDERRYVVNGERPGEFKKHDYVTGVNEVGSYPDEVEGDLTELIEEISSIGSKAPLKSGAYLHARFESIHPFADGNGRVGRTLTNYWLMINDYPPMIIYDEDKKDYYAALQKYDEQEDLDALVDFFQRQTVKTWERSMKLSESSSCERKGLGAYLQ